jgi:hypothetical protein
MPEPSLGTTPTGADAALVDAHARLLTDRSLQFDRTGLTPPAIPDWFSWIGDLLRGLGPVLKIAFWGGLALIAAALLFLIGRELLRLRMPRARPRTAVAAAEPEWRPDVQTARNLLAEADALARDGRFAEAAHLLLLRSVEDIERRKPRALKDSLTTREIANHEGLPDAARPAFAEIGRVVERSLFGGLPVDAEAFSHCREAYEAFALPGGWRA